ncbi:hypothetical protein [Micromonospora chokoriensis]|uniref:hypothetical protein n=1 Tax=Micromonospora chokoriensis TaxID=356851 RepID=UPI0012FD9059|nr:hypothetical protein [Micromonospora chokoriensis]
MIWGIRGGGVQRSAHAEAGPLAMSARAAAALGEVTSRMLTTWLADARPGA